MQNPFSWALRDDASVREVANRQTIALLAVIAAACWLSALDHGTARAHARGHQPPLTAQASAHGTFTAALPKP